MHNRHIDYPGHYNPIDIILDLNFYNFIKDVYNKLSEKSLNSSAIQLKQSLDKHDFTDYFLDYCKGVRPYPGGVPWLGEKRIFIVMALEKIHFVALEFMINDRVINVYDCNLPCCPEDEFFQHIQPVMELWPRFLKQSGMFNHLPPKLLNKEWIYDQKTDLPKNETGATCCAYSLSFIEHLITNTLMHILCDNIVEQMRWRWVVGLLFMFNTGKRQGAGGFILRARKIIPSSKERSSRGKAAVAQTDNPGATTESTTCKGSVSAQGNGS
ncbi:hypothetical protein HAX54_034309 [Datura stramonium]|uniref:Ubiquitin-like protease family profile domain-containing protein n=1 Tax=Datura stramonium TaxID=4076 RepID=A0ABS8VDS8_DATST|nr:hypothetical protein [Datura stramonium]